MWDWGCEEITDYGLLTRDYGHKAVGRASPALWIPLIERDSEKRNLPDHKSLARGWNTDDTDVTDPHR